MKQLQAIILKDYLARILYYINNTFAFSLYYFFRELARIFKSFYHVNITPIK